MTGATTAVLADQPRVAQALTAARELAVSENDPDLLAIAERRIGELLGVAGPAKQAPTASRATPLTHAVLVFVEQWVIDVASITDDMVSTLRDELGEDRLMDFIHGVLATEQRIRLELAWDKLGVAK